MRARYACTLTLLSTVAACSGKNRPFADTPIDGVGGSSAGAGVPAVEQDTEAMGAGFGVEPGAAPGEPLGGVPVQTLSSPDDTIQSRGNIACEADAAACAVPDAGSVPAVCVPSGPRDCSSDLDSDCNGQPDNTLDDVCQCVPGTSAPCDEHAGLDGQGQCRAGLRICLLDEVTLTSTWNECEGSVGPGDADSCEPGDDTDCDGTPNEGCSCVDGTTQPCGSNTNAGPCQIGTSTCVNGSFGPCVGAIAPASADSCSSQNDDSNCNGIPFDGCSCVNGETQSCGTTDTGVCQLGTRTCVNGAFGQCVGAVNPRGRDCRSQQDNDCDGRSDNTIDTVCQCSIGSSQACQTHPSQDGVGRCRAGSQQCVAGPNNSSSVFGACNGSVGPAQRDACTSINDDDCDGLLNDGCQCVSSRGNADCSGNPDASRCNGATGQCVGCQSNADCSLISGGRNLCQAGRCVSPIRPLGESCTAGSQCESGVCDPFYRDNDRDGYAPQGTVAESFCSVVGFTKTQYTRLTPTGRSIDCLDTNIDVNPGQAAFFTMPANVVGFDYNCDGEEEKNSRVVVDDDVCFADGADGTCSAQGIAEDTPCGETMVAGACVANGPSSCRLFFGDSVGTRACH